MTKRILFSVFSILMISACSSNPPVASSEPVASGKRNVASECGGERIVCTDRIEICVDSGFLMIPIMDGNQNPMPTIEVADFVSKALAKGNFKALDKKTTMDSEKVYTLKFKISGKDVTGQDRLGIGITGGGINKELRGCAWAKWQKGEHASL